MPDPVARRWKEFDLQGPPSDALAQVRGEWTTTSRMGPRLDSIDFDLAAEAGRRQRAVPPPSRREPQRLVLETPMRSPPHLPGGRCHVCGSAAELEQAAPTIRGRMGGKLPGVHVLARPGYFNLVDLRFFFPTSDFDERLAYDMAVVVAESLLGKETFARWIGDIDVQAQSALDERLIGLDELPSVVRRIVEETQAGMPGLPWHQMDLGAGWSTVEGEPEEADDYPGQSDLVAGITLLPLMWHNALSSIPFDSARYSRFDESFCYLKMDGSAGWEYSDFSDREEIEQTLDASLRADGLGRVVGGGTGLRYSYIEFALADVDRAWREIGIILSEGRVPKRTWLLFHDRAFSSRWLGLYEDTPPPREG